MKFACPKCQTKYSVADEKIPTDKTLRFTCKKCQNVFRLKRKAKPRPKSAKPKTGKPRTGKPKSARPRSGPAKEERVATKPGEATHQTEEAATRVANLREIMAVKKRSKTDQVQEDEPPQAAPVSPFVQDDEWFVLVSGKQTGPLTPGQVRKLLGTRKIDKRTYAWRDGMADWARLGVVPEFEDLAMPPGAVAAKKQPPRSPTASVREQRAVANSLAGRDETVERAALVRQTLAADVERQRTEEARAFSPVDEMTHPAASIADDETSGDALVALLGEPTGDSMLREEAADEESTAQLDLGALADDGQDMNNPFTVPATAPMRMPSDDPGVGVSPVSRPEDYLDRAPGQETRVFMLTAGLYKRRRMHKIAAIAGGIFAAALVTFVVLDLTGLVQLPGMGRLYEATGLEDPNMDRAITRTEEKLQDVELSPEERVKLEKQREAMRARLLGKPKPAGGPKGGPRVASAGGAGSGNGSSGAAEEPPTEVGIKEAKNVDKQEHDLTAAIMGDRRKKTKGPKLKPPSEIQAPNLPEGLTQEAIVEVISKNQRAMSLCISQSMKAGENLTGKMEVEMSINATGRVGKASIQTARFENSTIGNCTVKTVKRWRFPAFNGKPVTVIFPYVLSAAL